MPLIFHGRRVNPMVDQLAAGEAVQLTIEGIGLNTTTAFPAYTCVGAYSPTGLKRLLAVLPGLLDLVARTLDGDRNRAMAELVVSSQVEATAAWVAGFRERFRAETTLSESRLGWYLGLLEAPAVRAAIASFPPQM